MSGNEGRAGLILQRRDYRLLAEAAIMRLFDRELAKICGGFRSTTRINTRLLKLTKAGLLKRFFIGSTAAGRKAIYTLSTKGAVLIGAEYRGISRTHGKTLVGDLFVTHQMQINQIYAAVKFRPLPVGCQLLRWRIFHQPVTNGSRLIPDGYFELQTPSGIRSMFIEVDLGHQSMKVWEQKVRSYLQLAVSGEFTRLSRQPQFRVLILAPSQRRLSSIRTVIAKQTDKIFWLSDIESIDRESLWTPIWIRPKGDERLSLI